MGRGLEAPTGGVRMGPVIVTRADGAAHGILVWHDCTAEGGWVASGAGLHTADSLADLEHLTLSPSLFWSDCCGLHGWVRGGVWVDA